MGLCTVETGGSIADASVTGTLEVFGTSAMETGLEAGTRGPGGCGTGSASKVTVTVPSSSSISESWLDSTSANTL